METTPLLYNVPQAAQALNVSRDTLYQLIRSGRLRSLKLGSRRLVPVGCIAEFINKELEAA